MKTVAIVAGGTLSEHLLEDIKSHDVIVGVDRGAWWLVTYKIVPDYAIGDFDSVSPKELTQIKEISPNVVQYEIEKNETDLELALELVKKLDPTSITVFGSLGSRFDHSLAGIFLLERFQQDITVVDENNQLSVIKTKKIVEQKDAFPYCSFLSLSTTAEITLEGFRYPLRHGILHRNKTLGISNEILKKNATVTVHRGVVLCIQSNG